ncbi:hypothetical protein K8B33_09100 [Alcanivorax sp. JB21]|uniref:hypothetical protein n=1 Tax=Alcanivorax limicola TaxID=2874102 RepID=UPI001CC0919F|nr:hypothetical protein [Alcanivorax limicola]MBZ2189253.1 hypothetical protein [Alcanivorax limicola]
MSEEFIKHHSLHDNHIHGLSYTDENFETELKLDIDYIHERHCDRTPVEFVVAPAWLIFRGVMSYRASLIRTCPTLNGYLGIILGLKIETVDEDTFRYTFSLVGDDKLEVEARSIALVIWGEDVVTQQQSLSTGQRHAPDKQRQLAPSGPDAPTARR